MLFTTNSDEFTAVMLFDASCVTVTVTVIAPGRGRVGVGY